MVPLPVAVGFIPACFLLLVRIAPTVASRVTSTDTVGLFPGRQIAVSFITAPLRVPMDGPGANARNSSGGTKHKRSGQDWMFRISPPPSHLTTSRPPARKVTPHLRAIGPSFCIRMDWDGF